MSLPCLVIDLKEMHSSAERRHGGESKTQARSFGFVVGIAMCKKRKPAIEAQKSREERKKEN
jgi:hypothetical protein